MKKFMGALALVAALAAVLPLRPALAAIRHGGGIYPPAPLVAHPNAQPTSDGGAHTAVTIAHQGATPASSWSCSIFVYAGRAGSLSVVWMQGYQSCNEPMSALNITFYYRTCFANWFGGCFLPGPTQWLGFPTCYSSWGSLSQWCPASGTYNKAFNPGTVVQIMMMVTDTGPDGSVGVGEADSGGIQL